MAKPDKKKSEIALTEEIDLDGVSFRMLERHLDDIDTVIAEIANLIPPNSEWNENFDIRGIDIAVLHALAILVNAFDMAMKTPDGKTT